MAVASRSQALGRLLEELEALPTEEVWRVRVFAGLRRIVHERRRSPEDCDLVGLLAEDATGFAMTAFGLLDARSLAVLGSTRRVWRGLSQWPERWYLLGVEEFGQQRRLVPTGRFERFDEAVLDSEVDWHRRYCDFVMAAGCTSIHSLRLAAARVAQTIDLENSGVEEVRRRLAAELKLAPHFLSVESVEQLLEDACAPSSAMPRPPPRLPGPSPTGRLSLSDAALAAAAADAAAAAREGGGAGGG